MPKRSSNPTMQTGPRGGHYYWRNGKKVYDDLPTTSKGDALVKAMKERGYKVNLATEAKAKQWLESVTAKVVYDKIIDGKSLKQCGTLSTFMAGLAAKKGIAAGVVGEPGHYTMVIPLSNGKSLRVDPTHLQFRFPYHGGLRDFSREERSGGDPDYRRMVKLFEELKTNPGLAIKITKQDFTPGEVEAPPRLSDTYNPRVFGPLEE